MTPDQITAVFGGAVAVLGAVFGYLNARQTRKIAELQHRVDRLESELTRTEGLLRAAVRYIRTLLAHITEVTVAHRLNEAPPEIPAIPEQLAEEI
ncbi:hypothetical protein [Nocardia otitidiscaviarum]|uniref:hypothetical protein n=1 Tax=Nocardia otitidiscaviarum TaxID=1823 RepID=UPI0004A760BD|nr:hypothetical protein [Nocardia otitidiscaviarum]